MSFVKIEPYADGVIRTVYMHNHPIPPTPEYVETPWGTKARVRKELYIPNPDDSMRKSLSRTKNHICAYAHNMSPEWFGTLTFSPDKVSDRYNMNLCRNIVSKWLENIRCRKCPDMMYLVVPERHKDGAWHFHILLSHVDALSFLNSGKRDGMSVIYNLENWRYGFTNFTKVRDAQKTATYMSKYVTKDLITDAPNRQRYLVSKNIPLYEAVSAETSHNSAEEFIVDNFGIDTQITYERTFDMAQTLHMNKPCPIRLAFLVESEVIENEAF